MSRPDYGWRGRVGLIVPPANTTIEPEFAEMLPAGVSLHVARLPGRVSNQTSIGLRERFIGYNESLSATSDSFGGAKLSALGLGVTGSCYLAGFGGEERLVAAMRSSGAEHVATAAGALRNLIETTGRRRRLALIVPYPAWLTEMAVAYWHEAEFTVSKIIPIANVESIYEVRTEAVVRAADQLQRTDAELIVLSGTGVATLPAIEQLSRVLPIPVISSNLALGWWLLKAVGISLQDVECHALRELSRWLPA
jgi:maleate isomerase